MRKMKKVLALALALLLAFSAAACTPKQPAEASNAPGSVPPAAEPTDSEKEPVTIQFMHSMVEENRQAVIQGIIDEFSGKYSWITVEQIPADDSAYDEKMTAMAGGGDLPAVIEVNQNRAKWFASNEFTDFAANKEVIDGMDETYYDAILKINTSEDGANYIGVPVGGWVQGIWYNKTAFDEKGLAAPDTWENILAAAKAFYDPDHMKYGIALPTVNAAFSEQSFSQFALSNGANALDAEGNANFDSPEMIEALTFYKQLYQYSIQGSNDSTEIKDAMVNGTVPMGVYSTYILSALINAGLMDDYAIALPTKKTSASYGSVGMLTITNDLTDAQREAAVLFAGYLVQKDNNISWLHMSPGGQQPVIKGVAEEPAYLDNETIQAFSGISNDISAAFGSISLFGIVDGHNFLSMGKITTSGAIAKAVYDVTVNDMDPAEVAAAAQAEIVEIIAE